MRADYGIPEIEMEASLPVMDREQIDMLLMVDEGEDPTSLVRELFELFESEGNEKLEGLSAACSANDVRAVRNIIHFVAGSAGNLGLARLNCLYRAVEHAIDEGRLTDVRRCEAPIRSAFEDACAAFRKEFEL
ncbi:MAG: Hpt domain-containing protein [Verrucomicrobiota bacterium]